MSPLRPPPRPPVADWYLRYRLKLRQLQLIVALCDLRNIGRVARQMNTSQPAVSKAIVEVERMVGVRLFARSVKGTVPTPEGESLARHGRWILRTLDRASDEIAVLKRGGREKIRVGANYSASAGLVPKTLLRLRQRDTRHAMMVREGPLDMLMLDLKAGELDVVIARADGALRDDDILTEIIGDEPMCLITGPQHPLARRRRVGWKDLGGFPWIVPPERTPVREGLRHLFRQHGIVADEPLIESGSMLASTALLREIDAISTMPMVVARQFAQREWLAILPVPLPQVFGAVGIFINRRTDPSPALALFLECLRETARDMQGDARRRRRRTQAETATG